MNKQKLIERTKRGSHDQDKNKKRFDKFTFEHIPSLLFAMFSI